MEEARDNLGEALELFFETADQAEIDTRLSEEVVVTHVDVTVAWTSRSLGSEACAILAANGLPKALFEAD